MQKFIEYFAKQKTFVDLVTIFVFALGIYSMVNIQREVFPNVEFDLLSISTVYQGAAPDAVEKLVTNKLEQDLKEVTGIKKMTSVSQESLSVILLQVDPDQTTIEEAKSDAQEVVDRFIKPDGAENPNVKTIESKLTPTVELSISGEVDENILRDTAKLLGKQVEKVKQVAKIEYQGKRDLEIRVEADLEKLSAYRLSLSELVRALSARNQNIPGGTLESAQSGRATEYILRTMGEYDSLKEIENTVVRSNSVGQVIQVKDVAKVSQQFAKETIKYRTNGKPAITLVVLKKEGGDSIKAMEGIQKTVDLFRANLPPSIEVSVINDLSVFVKRRVSVLTNNLGWGLVLVVVILAMILPFRVGVITSIGIPFAFLGAIIIFYFNDISINLISMMGLIIVVGMLVDDAVVVTENAQRLREEGLSPMEAAIKGTNQIWAPVTVSVLTTVLAFAPMMFMSGIMGKFVKNIPIGVILALAVSLLECFFILPHHLGHWIKDDGKVSNTGVVARYWDGYIAPAYKKLTGRLMNFRYVVVLVAFVGLILTFMYASKMTIKLFPAAGVENFLINLETEEGTSLTETAIAAAKVEKVVMGLPDSELKDFTAKVGEQRIGAADPAARRGTEYAQIRVFLHPEADRERSATEIIEKVKAEIGIPEGVKQVKYTQVAGGPPVGKPVNIGVRGADYDDILPIVNDIKARLGKVEGVTDIASSYIPGKRELNIKLDHVKAASVGLNIQNVGIAIRSAYDGLIATSIQKVDEEINIRVQVAEKARKDKQSLGKILIPNNNGQLIPLEKVAKITEDRGVALFQHENNERQVIVFAEIDNKLNNSNAVNALMEKNTRDIVENNPNITLFFGGENEDTKESIDSLGKAGMFSFFSILLVLILLFKSFIQAMIIGFTIPMGVASVIFAFALHNQPISFLGAIGIVALSGVIVNNAIVFIDFVNRERAAGSSRRESIIFAASRRLRPIVLTTITTAAGILPTAYGLGGKDPFVVPLALALGWGVLFGSTLTALILPSLIAITDDIVHIFKKDKAIEKAPVPAEAN